MSKGLDIMNAVASQMTKAMRAKGKDKGKPPVKPSAEPSDEAQEAAEKPEPGDALQPKPVRRARNEPVPVGSSK